MGFALSGIRSLFRRRVRAGHEAKSARTQPLIEQRRARRVRAALQILLYGRLADEPFQERTETIDVSSHGGLFPVSAAVVPAQKLIVTNLENDEELACRVTRLVHTDRGRILAAVEFLQPSLRFWGAVVSAYGHENSSAQRIS
jgi:hypothetical protein